MEVDTDAENSSALKKRRCPHMSERSRAFKFVSVNPSSPGTLSLQLQAADVITP